MFIKHFKRLSRYETVICLEIYVGVTSRSEYGPPDIPEVGSGAEEE
jgi:hypothetical protein